MVLILHSESPGLPATMKSLSLGAGEPTKQVRKEATVIIAGVNKDTTMGFPAAPFPPALLAMHSIMQRHDLLQFGPSQHLILFPLSHLGGNHEANT